MPIKKGDKIKVRKNLIVNTSYFTENGNFSEYVIPSMVPFSGKKVTVDKIIPIPNNSNTDFLYFLKEDSGIHAWTHSMLVY